MLWRISLAMALKPKVILARSLLCIGLFMAMAVGTSTHLVLPGIGSIGASAAVGALIGWTTWLIIGTVGVVPLGIAVGVWSIVSVATGLSVVGGLSSGIGLKTILVPFVPPAIWVPILFTGLLVRRSTKNKDPSRPIA
jgi:hypothetical protein